MKCTHISTFVYTHFNAGSVYTQPCIRVYTKPVYTQNSTRPDQTRPDLCCQSVLTTTSHTTTGCGTYVREELPHGPNDPTHEPTAAGTTPPSHHPDPTGVYTQIFVYTKLCIHRCLTTGCIHRIWGIRPGVTTSHNRCRPRPPTRPRGVVRSGGTTPRSKQLDL